MTGRWEGGNIPLCWGPRMKYRVDSSGNEESSFRASETRPGIQKKLDSCFRRNDVNESGIRNQPVKRAGTVVAVSQRAKDSISISSSFPRDYLPG